MANHLQHAQLGGKKAEPKNPFRNPSLDKQVEARKAKAQDVKKAGQFQDHNKTVKKFQKGIEPVGSTSKLRGTSDFGRFMANAPATTAMRGRV